MGLTYGGDFLLPGKPPFTFNSDDRVLARRTPSSVSPPSACTSEGDGGCVGSIRLPWWPRSPTTAALVTMIVAAWEAVAVSPTARVAESGRPTAMEQRARVSKA